tara:strand:+ start:124 stop:1026 length:903 start_codon:yes stop_codon:yes gene_type:complete
MTSQIVRTNPTAGTATTSSVRNNFGFAADEINRLLRANTDKVVATGTNSIVANFPNVPSFALVDGIRVLIEIANTTASATPTLNVNSSGAKSIKKSDGSSLDIGDLVAGGYYEFVYDSGEDGWKVLNVVTSFESPQFTGVPIAPTAAAGTDTTQLATTAFVGAAIGVATPDASDTVKGLIELATGTEVKAGVDAVKALTAANLLRVAVDNTQVTSNGDQGSLEIAGVVVKWGEYYIPSGTTQTITFDNAFPNFCSVAFTQREATNPNAIAGVVAGSRTTTSFQVDTNNFATTIYWFAIGG